MRMMPYVGRALAALVLSMVATSAFAQAVAIEQKPFEPVSGQAGKDVVWVPTPQSTVDKMLELTRVTSKDVVIDLGSGNGITVITAAKLGATAMGVEFNPEMVALARQLASEAGVSDRATFVQGDLFEADLSKATVITLFLLPDLNEQLKPKLLELRPGTRIASNTFEMGDWEPDARSTSEPCTSWCTALSWVVPAKVAGTWQLGQQALILTQQYQVISGTLGATPITAGKLNGEDVTFTVGDRVYTGKVNGDSMAGQGWSATKTPWGSCHEAHVEGALFVGLNLQVDEARAVALTAAIHGGDVEALRRLVGDAPALATARVVDARGVSRTLLHVVADWPGHVPNGAQAVAVLVAAGADVNARVIHPGPHGAPETPLHWAASSDDVDVLDALLDAGADIEAPGAAFTGGTPLSHAVVFAQWRAARRLVERGATTTLWQSAALGLLDRVHAACASAAPQAREVTNAFWHACRGGQQSTAAYLLNRGADLNWVGHDGKTPYDVAHESADDTLIQWLLVRGGRRAAEVGARVGTTVAQMEDPTP